MEPKDQLFNHSIQNPKGGDASWSYQSFLKAQYHIAFSLKSKFIRRFLVQSLLKDLKIQHIIKAPCCALTSCIVYINSTSSHDCFIDKFDAEIILTLIISKKVLMRIKFTFNYSISYFVIDSCQQLHTEPR